MCNEKPAEAIVAYEGILDVMEQCRERTQFQSWDCSTIPGTVLNDPSQLKYGTKETAYLWAMSSAGAAWGIATACAQGWLDGIDCKCVASNARTGAKWEWNGCPEGLTYAMKESRKLLTRTERTRPAFKALERHNQRVGRQAVKRTQTTACKCHGVSGSCQYKHCWEKKLGNLDTISEHLTEKYRNAKFVNGGDISKERHSDLIYIERSPDQCKQFHYDIQHRRSLPKICNWRNETHSRGDCDQLCCGHGYTVSYDSISYKCNCKVVWCCKLECEDCLQHRYVSTCNT
ncbi:wnt family protein [Aphelenchoides avenae]|nr:wnt family protein [Aphelenchus avenae]